MKLSRFLLNIKCNFPLEHPLHGKATSDYPRALRAEWRCDWTEFCLICEDWGLDPINLEF